MGHPINPILYVNIEHKTREFSSKLLLACAAAEFGFDVLCGQQWLMNANIRNLPPGIFIFKSLNAIHMNAMASAKKSGHLTIASEEEVLAHVNAHFIKQYLNERFNQSCDYYFACSEVDAAAVTQSFPNKQNEVIIVGNPRIDLLRRELRPIHQAAINSIREKHGHYILLNGNYGIINSNWGGINQVFSVCVQAGDYDPENPKDVQAFLDYAKWEQSNLDAALQLIDLILARLPQQKIIVRPHPGENIDKWIESIKSDRVSVIREGSHLPWTLASQVMVHSSCTTGIEAQLAGHPTVNLLPYNSPADHHLSSFINTVTRTSEEAFDSICAVLQGSQGNPRVPRQDARLDVRSYIPYTEGICSFEAHVDAIAKIFFSVPHHKTVTWNPNSVLNNRDTRSDKHKAKMTASLGEAREVIESFKATLNRFNQIQVDEVGDSLFYVRDARTKTQLPIHQGYQDVALVS